MAFLRNITRKQSNDYTKTLHELKRQELLELLLEQTREADRLRGELNHAQESIDASEVLADRLKAKLNDKDAQINHLKARLDDKDAALQELFSITRDMATTSGQAERLALLLKAEDVLADRYFRQSEATVLEATSEPNAASVEEATASDLISDESDTIAAFDSVPAKHLDTLASTAPLKVTPAIPAPSTPVDYLYLDSTPLARVEEVR